MKRSMCTHKLTRILGFWILFFVLVGFMMLSKDYLGNKVLAFVGSSFGVLLIGTYVNSKESIKRLPYFLSLLALLLTLAILPKIFISSSLSFLGVFFTVIFYFTMSYFLMSSIYIMPVITKGWSLLQSILGLEIQSEFISATIISLSFLGVFYPFVILKIKRLNDINLSGWFSLITFIPFISVLFEIFLCLKGSAKKKSIY